MKKTYTVNLKLNLTKKIVCEVGDMKDYEIKDYINEIALRDIEEHIGITIAEGDWGM